MAADTIQNYLIGLVILTFSFMSGTFLFNLLRQLFYQHCKEMFRNGLDIDWQNCDLGSHVGAISELALLLTFITHKTHTI